MAVVAFRTTDKLKYKVGSVVMTVSPLGFHGKATLSSLMNRYFSTIPRTDNDNRVPDQEALNEASKFAMKNVIKGISGIQFEDGTEFECSFEEDGTLDDETIDIISNLQEGPEIVTFCHQFIKGVPTSLPQGIERVEEKAETVAPKRGGKK